MKTRERENRQSFSAVFDLGIPFVLHYVASKGRGGINSSVAKEIGAHGSR